MSHPIALDSLRELLWNPGMVALTALLLLAAWTDWRSYRIPNWLTVGGMVWGLAWSTLSDTSPLHGLLTGLGGLSLGLALFLPLWLLRAMGAGDVKLMAMVGAYLGPGPTFACALIVGMVGGIAVLGYALAHGRLARLAHNMRALFGSMVLPGVPLWRPSAGAASVGRLPYGVCIAVGTFVFLMLRAFWL